MKILLLLDESWNDKKHPNNNMTNWFKDFPDAEIYTVSGGPDLPENQCCKNYFQVSDREMLRSIYTSKRAGKVLRYDDYPTAVGGTYSKSEEFVYKRRKKFSFPLMRLARSVIWRLGRYDKKALGDFIRDFDPDIIFSQRMGSVKMCRMEKIVSSFTDAPIIAYTGDDEYSLRRVTFWPSAWIGLFWTRAWIRRMAKRYKIYYSMSQRQIQEYAKKFKTETKFLVKCGSFDEKKIHTGVNSPIRLVYAGKLYCNRWKTLGLIAEALRDANRDGVRAVLDIYTADGLTKKQRKTLHDGKSSFVHSAVGADELVKIYSDSDIVLHVEAFDLKNRLKTKYSFSTKVMDCLSSGAATMAVCWKNHAAYEYLKENDIALTASSREELSALVRKIADTPGIINEYAKRAYEFGVKHHAREVVQENLRADMQRVMNKQNEKR